MAESSPSTYEPRTSLNRANDNTFMPIVMIDMCNWNTAVKRNGTITAGGAAQEFAPANPERRGFWIQNQSTGDLYVDAEDTAGPGTSLRIAPGGLYEPSFGSVGHGAISVYGATTGQVFASREW